MTRPTLILAGIIGRYPVGGVTWCALHYIAGFQRLGYDVFYLEDTGECPYDPVSNGISKDSGYALKYLRRALEPVGLQDSWAYVDYKGRWLGHSRDEVAEKCRGADLMVNLSGGCWFSRPEYDSLTKVFIDTDPGFTQRAISEAGDGWYRDFFASYDALFTFGLNVASPSCSIPETGFTWHPTVQPVAMEFWPSSPAPADGPYSTILSWRVDSFPGAGRGKKGDLARLMDLPAKSGRRIQLAISGQYPERLLKEHGWELTDGIAATIDPQAYRLFIQSSKAELGFAKSMYVETNSGWFSDRTQCYLASGRPALVRDTGFSSHLPVGDGLLTFSNEQEILAGMDEIDGDLERHGRQAREIAREHFDSQTVLQDLLDTATVRGGVN